MRISSFALLFFLSAWLMPSIASACSSRSLPDPNKLSSYKAVFTGQITGIHLRDYQKDILGYKTDSNWVSAYDYTLPYTLTVVKEHRVHGSTPLIEEIIVTGCQVPEPKVRQFGLFFVPADGSDVIAIYDNERALYAKLVLELAIPVDLAYER